MKNLTIIFILCFTFCCCQHKLHEKSELEGDLYYTFLKSGSFYNQPDSVYLGYVELRDSLGIDELKKQNVKIFSRIELLEKQGLLKSPYIYLKTDSDSIFVVYMTPEVYEPITRFTYQQLRNNNQKVRLKLITVQLSDNLRICDKIVSIQKVTGETLQIQKKFKIEEYK